MTKPVCPYSRLIEPQRDGLLTSAERDALEKHLRDGCAVCTVESRYLGWLAGELRRAEPTIDEVSLQRQRMPLLMKAEQQRQRWYTQGQQRLGAVKGALAAVAVIGLALVLFDRSPRVSVERTSGDGEILRFTEGEHSIVQLNDGRYELQVSRGALDRALVVRLPDGEIEDLGTAFSVTVQSGRTTQVVVSEGAVQLRLQGLAFMTLVAGSVWELPRELPTSVEAQELHDTTGASGASSSGAAGASSDAVHAQPPAAVHSHSKAGKRAGAAATTAGANTEDAIYLRILDLLRADRKDAARALSERYLQEFPDGFRHAEVMRLVRPQSAESSASVPVGRE
jgi:hypothetical protein